MGKYKKYIWMAGLCCALPLTVSGQQVEPLTGADRLFNEGRELFLRQDYAAARQTLVRYTRQAVAFHSSRSGSGQSSFKLWQTISARCSFSIARGAS